MFTKRIHVFRAGDQTSAQGVQRNFSPQDLQQVVDTYDPSIHEAPVVLGHQGDNDSLPSFGWIQGFSREGQNLYADVSFSDAAKDLVKNGHYRKVSISFYSPDSQINPHTGKWSARHLALLGASPPAVKGLEPFSFREEEGCFDFAVSLSPDQIFDDELGPTLIVEKSPLEMLRGKLDEVRQDVSSAVRDLQESNQDQKETQVDQASNSKAPSEIASPDENQQFAERSKRIKTNEITQQTAELEDQFPEEQFMEDGKISRKHAKGAHGQVMQVVENVYDEQHKELPPALRKKAEEMKAKAKAHPGEKIEMEEADLDEQHRELPPALKAKAAEMKAKAKHLKPGEKVEMDEMSYDEVSYKTNPSAGVVKFGKKKESDEDDDTGRFETARSSDNGYADRMQTGKEGKGGVGDDRMNTAKSSEQDGDRMNTPKNAMQDADRKNTAKDTSDNATGESRWAGQADAESRVENMDQYDVDANSYPEPNRPKTASGANPAGREDADTKVPTETEESPDNEVFAVSTINVMSDGSMRVMRQKSSQSRQATKGGKINYAEPEADEMTSELGVTAMGEVDDDLVQGKAKLKKNQLDPGQFEGGVAEVTGPDGVFAESYKGEKKASGKQLTPGAMDEIDEAARTVGPDGAYSEDNLSGEFEGGPNQKTKRSGGVFAEEHGEGKKPYTKTGFGSTYGDDSEDDEDGEEDYNELSADHCGMNYGMGSMAQAKPMGYPEAMFEELDRLKKEHAELQRRYAEEKMAARRAKIASFVESLYDEGRLTDGIMPQDELQSYCEGLDFGTLEFSEGETAATKLLGLLSKLPPMVSYGEIAGGTFQYAEEDLDPHSKALKLVEAEGIDYVEAIKRTMYN